MTAELLDEVDSTACNDIIVIVMIDPSQSMTWKMGIGWKSHAVRIHAECHVIFLAVATPSLK